MARLACIVSLMLLVAAYVAAKVHFFTRYFELELTEYWAEHWPLTATLAVLTIVFIGAASLLARHTEQRKK